MKTIDGQTGQIIDDGLGNESFFDSGLGSATPTGTPNAKIIATTLGVPVGWVLLAGLGLILLAGFLNRR